MGRSSLPRGVQAARLCSLAAVMLYGLAGAAAEQRFIAAPDAGLATDGRVHAFTLPPGSGPVTVTVAPDGAVWFTEGQANRIGRLQPDTGEYRAFPLPHAGSAPRIIAVGADGNLWFSEHDGNRIGRITPRGQITEFELPRPDSGPGDITAGADGAMWFLMLSGTMDGQRVDGGRVGRITMDGRITEFEMPTRTPSPINIAVGPDGNIWYTQGSHVARVTADGRFTEFPLGEGSRGAGLSAGSDRQPPARLVNRLYVADGGANRIAWLEFAPAGAPR